MKKRYSLLTLFFAVLTNVPLFAQSTEEGLDQKINAWVQPATDFISSIVFYPIQLGAEATTSMPLVIIFLLFSALFFTIFFKFINIRGFGTAIKTVKGTYSDPNDAGEVSHFQALTAAVSGTVGLGNIAGVAIAISLGGPGATLWMILAGLLGMSSKFVECTLGVRYREIGPDGKVYGGPMYYLTKGLAEKGMAGTGKVLAVFFAIMCVGGSFGGGNMFQANQAAKQFLDMTGTTSTSAGTIFGVFMASMVALVIIGGIKRIGAVTERIVPFMCGIYILAALVVIIVHAASLPETIGKIFGEAFNPIAVAGGFVGVLVQGFRRAAFSNEAGVGSAAIAHSAVRTDYPASEGIVALLEPFIDTVVICTMTAIVVIITGDYDNAGAMGGVEMTSQSFATVLPWFPYVLTVTVVLFAFSTMISWSYYGLQAWLFLFGKTKLNDILYKVLFCCFVVVGAAASLGAVTDFSDAMIFAMSVPNLIGLFFLLPVVKKEVSKYYAYIQSGEWKQYHPETKK
jgi:alanine or glycine:cation symporter, AGCS family